jgi:hypothetical protein
MLALIPPPTASSPCLGSDLVSNPVSHGMVTEPQGCVGAPHHGVEPVLDGAGPGPAADRAGAPLISRSDDRPLLLASRRGALT